MLSLLRKMEFWKLAQYSVAPVGILVLDNEGFGSLDEEQTEIFPNLASGRYLNRQNEILALNFAPPNEDSQQQSASYIFWTLLKSVSSADTHTCTTLLTLILIKLWIISTLLMNV